jgi:hypothetical protein
MSVLLTEIKFNIKAPSRISALISDSCAVSIIAALALVTRLMIASGLSFSRGLMSKTWRYNLAVLSAVSGRKHFSTIDYEGHLSRSVGETSGRYSARVPG